MVWEIRITSRCKNQNPASRQDKGPVSSWVRSRIRPPDSRYWVLSQPWYYPLGLTKMKQEVPSKVSIVGNMWDRESGVASFTNSPLGSPPLSPLHLFLSPSFLFDSTISPPPTPALFYFFGIKSMSETLWNDGRIKRNWGEHSLAQLVDQWGPIVRLKAQTPGNVLLDYYLIISLGL